MNLVQPFAKQILDRSKNPFFNAIQWLLTYKAMCTKPFSLTVAFNPESSKLYTRPILLIDYSVKSLNLSVKILLWKYLSTRECQDRLNIFVSWYLKCIKVGISSVHKDLYRSNNVL